MTRKAMTLLRSSKIDSGNPKWLFILLLSMAPMFGGCRLGYYTQASLGQLKVIWNSEPIEDVLKRPNLDPERRRKLELVQDIRRFAMDDLGLTKNDNYTQFYDLKGQPITYTVVACPVDSLEPYTWWFPIVGTIPYIGYFKLEDAVEERDRLRALGYDTVIWPAAAYSTLGWFSDPVLSTMLEGDEVSLVDVIFHEQTHATIYEDDISFNESLAVFVGYAGSIQFFKARNQPEKAQRAVDLRHDQLIVSQATAGFIKSLRELYASRKSRAEKVRERRKIFARFRFLFRHSLVHKMKTKVYRYYMTRPYNNAVITTMGVYSRDISKLEKLYKESGKSIKELLPTFRKIAASDRPDLALDQALTELRR